MIVKLSGQRVAVVFELCQQILADTEGAVAVERHVNNEITVVCRQESRACLDELWS